MAERQSTSETESEASNSMHILGDDLLEEVLLRLPRRRYLSHYTSVRKLWHSLISSGDSFNFTTILHLVNIATLHP
ncbi:hypothetical protein PanWU01x14_148140 [Parasponia andersonii]|uniref:F-box domain containing protein n=1 Tax=Parasponia andersonii TaxID=3476 RepID=A0A2P5CJ13_PARAD|nr:hypothetical protein PanWU01x14_148140 [Parasponia andersonii]